MLLQAQGLAKSYGGVRALRGVDLAVRAGEIHALLGENGAGKSTLIKILTGAVQPDAGRILWDGTELGPLDPLSARRLGIGVVYQQPALLPDLSVAENIALGQERGGWLRRVDWRQRRARSTELLGRLACPLDPDRPVRELSLPEQQIVEIAKALGAQPRLLILDEPTASLSHREAEALFAVLRELRNAGTALLYISHRLEELLTLADHLTVLRDGALVETREAHGVTPAELIRLMVGRSVEAIYPKRTVPIGGAVLEVDGLSCAAAGVRDVSLTVRAGEIVGLAGLVGAGRTELAGTLFGLTPADAGTVRVAGTARRISAPQEAIAAGIALVPEDRKRHGVVPELPVAQNLSLAVLRQVARRGLLDEASEQALATRLVERLGVKTAGTGAAANSLSGGNQQKVAVGRWLATEPRVLMLDEPTQGVDVGAKAEIHALMTDLAAQGMGVLLISSELPEVLGMSDRVLVMHGGRLTGEFSRAEATQERVLAAALRPA